jgi:hypothetical protein
MAASIRVSSELSAPSRSAFPEVIRSSACFGFSPGSRRTSSAHKFVLSFLYDKLDTVFGEHTRNSGER